MRAELVAGFTAASTIVGCAVVLAAGSTVTQGTVVCVVVLAAGSTVAYDSAGFMRGLEGAARWLAKKVKLI